MSWAGSTELGSMIKRALPCLALAVLSCAAPRTLDGVVRPTQSGPGRAFAARSAGGLVGVEANWKERMSQPYVFLQRRGDYRRLGQAMRELLECAQDAGLETTGAPFALFFDDPGRVPAAELRARVCLPVGDRPGRLPERVEFDVLPRSMVVYARVRGSYPEVASAYPALFQYLHELGWRQGGPIREVYLVNPLEAQGHDDVLTEVQIPWVADE
jgi:effector-binding domain-containing protein